MMSVSYLVIVRMKPMKMIQQKHVNHAPHLVYIVKEHQPIVQNVEQENIFNQTHVQASVMMGPMVMEMASVYPVILPVQSAQDKHLMIVLNAVMDSSSKQMEYHVWQIVHQLKQV
jgi:hypothetical protein